MPSLKGQTAPYPLPLGWGGGAYDAPPPIKELTHVHPDKKGGAYGCPPFNLLPLLRGDIGAHPMSP